MQGGSRRALLVAALGFVACRVEREHAFWRATFYVAGREHSPTGATGSAFEATPFRAVQVAAWQALART